MAAAVPVIRVIAGNATSIQILSTDWDSEQVVRCRWSYQMPTDECGNACRNLPGASLDPIDCVISWTPVLRPVDIGNGLNQSTYVVAITVEDFANASSSIPISKTPLQTLIQVNTLPSNFCTNSSPNFIYLPHRDTTCFGMLSEYTKIFIAIDWICIAAGVNSVLNLLIRIVVYCDNDSIVEMTSLTPFGMTRTNLTSYGNNIWGMTFSWIPRANQTGEHSYFRKLTFFLPSYLTGVQPFCVAGIDNHGVSTSQYCLAIAVGSNYTNYYQSVAYVQGTWSPVGNVMSTTKRFSIQGR